MVQPVDQVAGARWTLRSKALHDPLCVLSPLISHRVRAQFCAEYELMKFLNRLFVAQKHLEHTCSLTLGQLIKLLIKFGWLLIHLVHDVNLS